GAATATMRVSDVAILDFGTGEHAIFGGGPAPIPGTVSFTVRWSGVQQFVTIHNTAQNFAGIFLRDSAQMEWTATVGPYRFVSAPMATSSSIWAEFGNERNGVYFPTDMAPPQ